MKPDEGRRKLTAEELFGDILADLEGPKVEEAPKPAAGPQVEGAAAPEAPVSPVAPAVKPTNPPPAPVAAPVPLAPVHAPQPMVVPLAPVPHRAPTAHVPTPKLTAPKLAPVHVPPVHAPKRPASSSGMPRISSPTASARELFKDVLEPLPEAKPRAAQPLSQAKTEEAPAPRPAAANEFTLSGISGINDPFEVETIHTDASISMETGSSSSAKVPAASFPAPAAPASVPPPMQAAAKPLVPPLENGNGMEEFGNYYLLEKIAVGGMAELFKARQRGVANFEKIVAIKRILPHLCDNDEFVRMFIDEAKLAAQLTHPNIAQIFDLGKAGGFFYIAMEYVDGKDLRSLLRKVREYKIPFPEAAAAFVVMKVANALDYAHRKRGMNDKELKLVHRDISPQNILISTEGAVKLVDFGIAKAATKSTQTMAGALKGKLLYMSPEQARGEQLDHRSDIYSLGLVLFELLTGERCFQADSELGVLEKVRMGKISDVRALNPDISPEMVAVLDKALQKGVDTRYPTARFMERDLKAMLVKYGNEPTEHDVAEFVNAMLRGTKEQVQFLSETRFQPKHQAPSKASQAIPVAPGAPLEEKPARAQAPGPKSTVPLPVPLPPPAMEGIHEERRRPWLVPVLMLAAVVAAIGIWIALR